MKHIIVLLVVAFAVSACGGAAPAQPTVDVGAIQTAAVQTSVAALMQPTATNTVPVEAPALPTDTPPAPAGSGQQHYAWNNIASQDSGGLHVEIARFVLADKSTIDKDFTLGGFTDIYNDRPVVAEIVFKITNTTQQIISIYPDQGKVIAGGEQIDLFDFAMFGTFGDDFSGEIHPGVTVIGGIWFGFKRTPVDQITTATIAFDGPSDQNFNTLGPTFSIVLDLSTRQDQPLPDDLK